MKPSGEASVSDDFDPEKDAMWTDEPFLYHSRLSAVLNVKLLNPRSCVDKAVEAHREGEAPINSVEGFVRQILFGEHPCEGRSRAGGTAWGKSVGGPCRARAGRDQEQCTCNASRACYALAS